MRFTHRSIWSLFDNGNLLQSFLSTLTLPRPSAPRGLAARRTAPLRICCGCGRGPVCFVPPLVASRAVLQLRRGSALHKSPDPVQVGLRCAMARHGVPTDWRPCVRQVAQPKLAALSRIFQQSRPDPQLRHCPKQVLPLPIKNIYHSDYQRRVMDCYVGRLLDDDGEKFAERVKSAKTMAGFRFSLLLHGGVAQRKELMNVAS